MAKVRDEIQKDRRNRVQLAFGYPAYKKLIMEAVGGAEAYQLLFNMKNQSDTDPLKVAIDASDRESFGRNGRETVNLDMLPPSFAQVDEKLKVFEKRFQANPPAYPESVVLGLWKTGDEVATEEAADLLLTKGVTLPGYTHFEPEDIAILRKFSGSKPIENGIGVASASIVKGAAGSSATVMNILNEFNKSSFCSTDPVKKPSGDKPRSQRQAG